MSFQTDKRPTRAHIDLDILAANFTAVKNHVGKNLSIMAVVKADAYGHGAIECALRLEKDGVDWFGVAIPEEGVALRQAGVKTPILCLGSVWPGQEHMVFNHDLIPVVYDLETSLTLNKYASEHNTVLNLHVKVDTGMGRVGFGYADAAQFASAIKGMDNLRVSGLLTHFASAENPKEDAFTNLQIERFNNVCEIFSTAGHSPEWLDMANSPGALMHPASHGNMVRLGGALYGLLDDIIPTDYSGPKLSPVMSLRSQIAHIKPIRSGESIGYGRTFTTTRDSQIALLPIGYADGYPRGLSNRGTVSVRGHIASIVGRISMDWTLIDVTDITDASTGDEVVLIGNGITAADLARQLDTIGYEITCGISPRVPRIYE